MQKIEPIKKKVLFITSTFPLDVNDSQAPWIGKMSKELIAKGFKLDVFAPSFRGLRSRNYYEINVFRFRYAPSFLEILTHKEGAVFKLNRNPLLFLVAILYVIFGSFAIIALAIKTKYDVIHVHWPLPQGIFGIIAKIINPNAKLILTFYGAEFSLANRLPFGKIILSFLIKKADRITAISNFTKHKIQDIEKIDVRVIPFASGISAKILNKKDESKQKHILFVGRLIERKGVTYLIRAISILHSDVILDVVGEGPLILDLKKEVIDLDLNKKVTFHGKVNEEKLKQLYSNCDIFVLPSIVDKWKDTEGLGVVLLEAMSFGKPVIGTNVGGIVDIIKDKENGIMVPQKDPEKLASAINLLLIDQQLRKKISDNGLKTVSTVFSWNKVITNLVNVYG